MDQENMLDFIQSLFARQQANQEHMLNGLGENLGKLLTSLNVAKEPSVPRAPLMEYAGQPHEDLHNWLFLCDQYFLAFNIPDVRRTFVATSYLRGAALQWYRRIYQERPEAIPFADFCMMIKATFLPKNYQQILRTKLDSLRQKKNLAEYVTEFMNLMNQIDHMSEQDRIHYFIRGLCQKTRSEVGYSCPQSLNHAIELAQNFDSNFFSSQASTTEPMDICFANSTAPRKGYSKSSKLFCRYCKKSGHVIEECRKKKSKSYDMKSEINQTSLYYPGDPLIKIRVSINGTEVSALVDTGANNSFISPKTALKCHLPVEESDATVTVANGKSEKVIGITKPTTVAHKHVSTSLPLVVITTKHDILLGMDFLTAVRANIDVAKKEIYFSPSLILNVETTESDYQQSIEDELYLDNLWPLEKDHCTLKSDNYLNLSNDDHNRLVSLLSKNEDLFAADINDLSCCSLKKHKIITDDQEPLFIYPYRKSMKERQIIQEEVQKMLKAGIIRESNSPWSSPITLVPKPDGTWRFCTDYRALNKRTTHDRFPMPRIDDVFDRLSGSKWFSKLDLKSGYWQIALDEESIPKSAFSTPDGHYEYLRMPFGMKNAPAEFSRIMQQVLGKFKFVQIYLDDITIHSKSFDEHLSHIESVFNELRKANLKLNKSKCQFALSEISLLGHIVSGKGIAVLREKQDAILGLKEPKSLKDVQRFLGMTGYYRKFIKGYAGISKPLYQLLKNDYPWRWDADEQQAFMTLKHALVSPDILRLPDLSKPFKLYTDASGHALGAVLAQVDDDNNEYVCQYESRLLKGAEVNYGISEKECLGIVWAIRKFRPYLYGNKFQVITDHSSLKWLMTIKEPTGRLARWSLYLQEYEFDIVHRKGTSHTNVDLLSRPILEVNASSKVLDPYKDEKLLNDLRCSNDAASQDYLIDGDNIYWIDGQERQKKLLIPPLHDRRALIEKAHLLGHFKTDATLKRIVEQYYWPGMDDDVDEYIKSCLPCTRHSPTRQLEHPMKSLNITGVLDRVGIDCVFGLPITKEGFKGIVVFTDYLSKYPFVKPIKTKSAEEIAMYLMEFISLFGPPKVLLSDQGTEFTNKILNEFYRLYGIEHKVTSAYNPRTNGQTERFNQTFVQCIKKHAEDQPERWNEWIPYVIFSYVTKCHSSSGHTPYELLFGRKPNNFSAAERDILIDDTIALELRQEQLKNYVESILPVALKHIEASQSKQRKSKNKKSNVIDPLEIGTQVYLKSLQMGNKLQPKYSGPYAVDAISPKGNYWLKNSEGTIMKSAYPITRLKLTKVKDETFEVESILEHKVEKGKIFYLVKWKGYSAADNTWEPENNFHSTECLEEYWKRKTSNDLVEQAESEGEDLSLTNQNQSPKVTNHNLSLWTNQIIG